MGYRIVWNKGLSKKKQPFYGKTHSKENREKFRMVHLGEQRTEESKRKQSLTRKRLFSEGKIVHGMLGRKHLEESKKRESETKKKNYASGKTKPTWKGKSLSKETKRKLSETHKRLYKEGKLKPVRYWLGKESPNKGKSYEEIHGKSKAKELKENLRQVRIKESKWKGFDNPSIKYKKNYLEAIRSIESRKLKSLKLRQKWKNIKFRNKQLQSLKKRYDDPKYLKRQIEILRKISPQAQKLRPNNLEISIMNILNKLYPNRFEYSEFVEGLFPDFIDKKNKIIIEIFGEYWHKNKKSIKWYHIESKRKEYFESKGYRILILWENEIKKDLEKIKEKIRKFI